LEKFECSSFILIDFSIKFVILSTTREIDFETLDLGSMDLKCDHFVCKLPWQFIPVAKIENCPTDLDWVSIV
jgi:hypothetical protein